MPSRRGPFSRAVLAASVTRDLDLNLGSSGVTLLGRPEVRVTWPECRKAVAGAPPESETARRRIAHWLQVRRWLADLPLAELIGKTRFIVLVAVMGGLKNVDRDMLLMSRLYGAQERHLFWHVRLPWCLPSLFAGLRLTIVYCTGGAVIGEMVAAQSGLGLLLQTYSSQFNIAQVLAILLVLVVMVSVLTGLLEVVENRLLRWSAGSTDVPS